MGYQLHRPILYLRLHTLSPTRIKSTDISLGSPPGGTTVVQTGGPRNILRRETTRIGPAPEHHRTYSIFSPFLRFGYLQTAGLMPCRALRNETPSKSACATGQTGSAFRILLSLSLGVGLRGRSRWSFYRLVSKYSVRTEFATGFMVLSPVLFSSI